MASRIYGRSILGMGESASKPAHSLFPIRNIRNTIDNTMVHLADCLATHNYVFPLYGLRLAHFHKHR